MRCLRHILLFFGIVLFSLSGSAQGDPCDPLDPMYDPADPACDPCIIDPTSCPGCTDSMAHNYDPIAGMDDGTCETCYDAIQNGDETGIDCGGIFCVPCNPFDCNEGYISLHDNCDPMFPFDLTVDADVQIGFSSDSLYELTGDTRVNLTLNGFDVNNLHLSDGYMPFGGVSGSQIGVDVSTPGMKHIVISKIEAADGSCIIQDDTISVFSFEVFTDPSISAVPLCPSGGSTAINLIYNGSGGYPGYSTEVGVTPLGQPENPIGGSQFITLPNPLPDSGAVIGQISRYDLSNGETYNVGVKSVVCFEYDTSYGSFTNTCDTCIAQSGIDILAQTTCTGHDMYHVDLIYNGGGHPGGQVGYGYWTTGIAAGQGPTSGYSNFVVPDTIGQVVGYIMVNQGPGTSIDIEFSDCSNDIPEFLVVESPCDTTTVSCVDGIQNGDETGVDCGGINCVPCGIDATYSYSCTDSGYVQVDLIYLSGASAGDCIFLDVDAFEYREYTFTGAEMSGDTVAQIISDIWLGSEAGYEMVVYIAECGAIEPIVNSLEIYSCEDSCFDGIQNGDETGIDCGGMNCALCDTTSNTVCHQGNLFFADGECGLGEITEAYLDSYIGLVYNDGVGTGSHYTLNVNHMEWGLIPSSESTNPQFITTDLEIIGIDRSIPGVKNAFLSSAVPDGGTCDSSFAIFDTASIYLYERPQYNFNASCDSIGIIIIEAEYSGIGGKPNEYLYASIYDLNYNYLGEISSGYSPSVTPFSIGSTSVYSPDSLLTIELWGDCALPYTMMEIANPCYSQPTCSDGFQNGDETGVDCGGTNCAPCGIACTVNFEIYDECTGSSITSVLAGQTPRLRVWTPFPKAYNLTVNGNHIITDNQGSFSVAETGVDISQPGYYNFTLSDIEAVDSTCNGLYLMDSTTITLSVYESSFLVKSVFDSVSLMQTLQLFYGGIDHIDTTGFLGINLFHDGNNIGFANRLSYEHHGQNEPILTTPYPIAVGDSILLDIEYCALDFFYSEYLIVEGSNEMPTCSDGIQNGDETGIDCGGVNCTPCSAAECNLNLVDVTISDCDSINGTVDYFITAWYDNPDMDNVYGGILAGSQNYSVSVTIPTGDSMYSFQLLDVPSDGSEHYLTISIDNYSTRAKCFYQDTIQSTSCPIYATCFDGIQNGDETGIDCGGTSCPPCMTVDTCLIDLWPNAYCVSDTVFGMDTQIVQSQVIDIVTIGGGNAQDDTVYIQYTVNGIDSFATLYLDGYYGPGTIIQTSFFQSGAASVLIDACQSMVQHNLGDVCNPDPCDISSPAYDPCFCMPISCECDPFYCDPCDVFSPAYDPCACDPALCDGCTDPMAHNYNPDAIIDDGNCETCFDGITNGDEIGTDCGGTLCASCNGEPCDVQLTVYTDCNTDEFGDSSIFWFEVLYEGGGVHGQQIPITFAYNGFNVYISETITLDTSSVNTPIWGYQSTQVGANEQVYFYYQPCSTVFYDGYYDNPCPSPDPVACEADITIQEYCSFGPEGTAYPDIPADIIVTLPSAVTSYDIFMNGGYVGTSTASGSGSNIFQTSTANFGYDVSTPGTYTYTLDSIIAYDGSCFLEGGPLDVAQLDVVAYPLFDITTDCNSANETMVTITYGGGGIPNTFFDYYSNGNYLGSFTTPPSTSAIDDVVAIHTLANLSVNQSFDIEIHYCGISVYNQSFTNECLIAGCTDPNSHNYDPNANLSIVCETCDDGIQNGPETGVDCGTPLCGPCQEAQDFFIISASISTSSALAGTDIMASCNQAYAGTSNDPVFVNMGYYISSDDQLSMDDELLAIDQSSLNQSTSVEGESAALTIPANRSGTNYILFVANYDKAQIETDENNNVSSVEIQIEANIEGDDFFVTGADISDEEADAGDAIEVSCLVNYRGSSTDTRFISTGYYLSDDASWSPDDILLGDDNSSLSLSALSDAEDEIVPIPGDIDAGTYYILFVADDTDAYAETDESNNVTAVQIEILPGPEIVYDFFISSPSTGAQTNFNTGDNIELACFQNYVGNSTTRLFVRMGYYISTDPSWNPSEDIFLGDDTSTLDADEPDPDPDDPESLNTSIPMELPTGSYYVLFVADYLDVFAETNENNNVSSVAITINNVGIVSDNPIARIRNATSPEDFSNISQEVEYSIYPNPTSGRFFVEITNDQIKVEDISLLIIDPLGRVTRRVDRLSDTKAEIDLTDHPPGVYQVITSHNQSIKESRLILIK